MSLSGITPVVGVLILLFSFTGFKTFAQATGDSTTYVVQPGDNLTKIAFDLGSPAFWEPIYEANRTKIKTSSLIYPGQKLIIPSSVLLSDKFTGIPQKKKENDSQSTGEKSGPTQQKVLEKFRQVFDRVVKKQGKEKATEKSPDSGLEFDGMVIDETRSKMGRDFFNVFYQYWEAPPKAKNFMLTITEHPVPSLGTMVSIKIDEQEIYKSRLQPRYSIIEELAKEAVVVSYRTLQYQQSSSTELTTY